MSDSNAWRQVRWMVLPALAGYGAMAGASDRDAFAEGRRVLQEASAISTRRPRPKGPSLGIRSRPWLVTWAATTGSPPRDTMNFERSCLTSLTCWTGCGERRWSRNSSQNA
jgi:hypothetical protein